MDVKEMLSMMSGDTLAEWQREILKRLQDGENVTVIPRRKSGSEHLWHTARMEEIISRNKAIIMAYEKGKDSD